ncbi:aminoglycoside phosphotransferase family protein [Paenibacillus polysaccharolyticus]|uniref:aminoglycoside phosphotransferase family protein n=1 Tax=Paenibacillus polysaccharolyticus TaxID=582692 RepID=UPI00209DAA42|nr:aminoglycoside phosphotransferase family protein [Paenibacillus polysaccharolyticus]MCP1134398.1 aminoglycoside phosphotransferase family protein [Paenibacillus polysaccharolyticus]
MSEQPEEKLTGGNVNEVVRVGDTVRRGSDPSINANRYVHELLLHLEKECFHQAPRYLGMDEKGREMLSYLDGDVPGNDYPEIESYMWSDESLIAVANLLRAYHDATVNFTTVEQPDNLYPGIGRDEHSHESVDTNSEDSEVVCHNDFALYNIVFRQGLPQGIIDFDLACPGPRMWDIAYTLYTCVPLANFSPKLEEQGKSVASYDSEKHANVRKKRIEMFMKAYGINVPPDLKHWVVSRIRFMCKTLEDRAAAGELAFVKMVEEGHLAHYEREVIFLEQHWQEWT